MKTRYPKICVLKRTYRGQTHYKVRRRRKLENLNVGDCIWEDRTDWTTLDAVREVVSWLTEGHCRIEALTVEDFLDRECAV